MKKTVVLTALWTFVVAAVLWPQTEPKTFSTYPEMRKQFGELYAQNKFKEAADLLLRHLDRFPEKRMANSFNLALTYVRLGEADMSVRVLQDTGSRGIWFGLYVFEDPAWEPLKKLESFKNFRAANDALRKEAQKSVRPLIEVIRPAGFVAGRKYPLFLALHGGNGSNAEFKKYWTSPKLQGDFITAYLQSSQLSDHDVYTWSEDLGLAKKEITDAYAEILKTYPVETGEVVIGGFSSGGEASLEAVFAGVLPATGFVVLCPPAPASLNATRAAAAAGRGVRGVLLTTEFDPRVADQKSMADLLRRAGFPLDLVVEPNLGHWIPEDLATRIDAGIAFLRKKGK